jgi:hypothetical protein
VAMRRAAEGMGRVDTRDGQRETTPPSPPITAHIQSKTREIRSKWWQAREPRPAASTANRDASRDPRVSKSVSFGRHAGTAGRAADGRQLGDQTIPLPVARYPI